MSFANVLCIAVLNYIALMIVSDSKQKQSAAREIFFCFFFIFISFHFGVIFVVALRAAVLLSLASI